MKNLSIKKKLVIVVFSLIIAFMASLLLLNTLFLEDFYIYTMKSDFIEEANEVEYIYNNDKDNLISDIKLRNNTKGYKYIIVDMKGNVKVSSVPEFNQSSKITLGNNQMKFIAESSNEIKSNGYKYLVLDNPSDDKDQIIILKYLNDDRTLVISIRLDGIRNNAKVANNFFVLSGCLMIIVVLIISYILSKKIVQPIIEINKETRKIANLDFDVSLNYKGNDEIAELSRSITFIANSLDQKINELNSANKLLEKDMISQRQFLASLAHEFKSPIGIINGYAESVKLNYYKNEDEKNEYIDYILEETNILNNIVEDIVLLAKLDKRDFKLNKVEINLSDLLERSLGKYKKIMSDKELIVKSSISREILLSADSIRVEQIINNLLSNVARYTIKAGNVTIDLRSDFEYINLLVKNTSSFIDEGEIESILKPFYRLDESRSRETGGHGLGLAIVDGLVTAHDGKIKLDYKDGEFNINISFLNRG